MKKVKTFKQFESYNPAEDKKKKGEFYKNLKDFLKDTKYYHKDEYSEGENGGEYLALCEKPDELYTEINFDIYETLLDNFFHEITFETFENEEYIIFYNFLKEFSKKYYPKEYKDFMKNHNVKKFNI